MPIDSATRNAEPELHYLMILDSVKGDGLIDKVMHGFMRRAFFTNATLHIVSRNTSSMEIPYSFIEYTLCGGSCKFQLVSATDFPLSKLIPNFDFYIAGNNPDEWTYLDVATNNGVPIIGTVESEEEMFADIPKIEQIEQWKVKAHQLVLRIFKIAPPTQYEYFLFRVGLGESLGFFYWLKEYRKISKKKILLFCVSDVNISLMSLSPYVDLPFKVPPAVFDYLYIFCSKDYEIKNFSALYHKAEVLKLRNETFTWRKTGILSSVQDYLGIPIETKFSRYDVKLPEQSIANAQKTFSDMGFVQGRTVFMATEGISQPLEHHKNFWIKLARRLREKNFEVVTNSPEPIIPDCKNIFLPLAESSAFVGLCGNVVSVTTGFTEAICSLNATDKINLHILTYSQNDAKKPIFFHTFSELKYYGRRFFENWMDNFLGYLELVMPPNVKYSVDRFGDTPEEDDAVIEKIVDEILRDAVNV